MKETIQKKKLAKSEIRILHVDDYGKIWHMLHPARIAFSESYTFTFKWVSIFNILLFL